MLSAELQAASSELNDPAKEQRAAECQTLTERGADCPICLADDVACKDKATVNPCMHAFCLKCLLQWLDLKRTCPLCKGRIASYYYDVSEEGNYNERLIPSSPPRSRWEPAPRGHPPMVPLIDESWPRGSMSLEHIRGLHRSSQWREQWRDQWRRGDTLREYPAASERRRYRHGSSQEQTEPRPYYHRMRAMVSAQSRRRDTRPDSSLESEEQQLLVWRRHIYAKKLFAAPAGSVFGSRTSDTSNRRLQTWVRRELRAVLRVEDVSLLTSLVMGIALSFKAGSQPSEQHPSSDSSAIRALEPYLGPDAAQFWHELRCFARSPYNLETYDKLVRYSTTSRCQGIGPVEDLMGFELWRDRNQNAGAAERPVEPSSLAPEPSAHTNVDPSRGSAAWCPTCSRAGSRTGLCLDCAERQALEDEAATAAPPLPPLQLPAPAPQQSTQPRTPSPIPPSASSAQGPGMRPETDQASAQRTPGAFQRIAFSIARSRDPSSQEPQGVQSRQHRKRRAPDAHLHTDMDSMCSRGGSPHGIGSSRPHQASSRGATNQPEASGAASGQIQSTLGRLGERDSRTLEGRPAELGKRRHEQISRLAAERLRELLNTAPQASGRVDAQSGAERGSMLDITDNQLDQPKGIVGVCSSSAAAEPIIILSDSDSEEEVICLTPLSSWDEQAIGGAIDMRQPKFIRPASWRI